MSGIYFAAFNVVKSCIEIGKFLSGGYHNLGKVAKTTTRKAGWVLEYPLFLAPKHKKNPYLGLYRSPPFLKKKEEMEIILEEPFFRSRRAL